MSLIKLVVLALAACITIQVTVATTPVGFTYTTTFSDNTPKVYQDYVNQMKAAQGLVSGNNSFTSARLYTMRQPNSNAPIEAIQAAIDTNTTLLLGLWASNGSDQFYYELYALSKAIKHHGANLTNLIVGISVGSEDIHRNVAEDAGPNDGPGANQQTLLNYIRVTRSTLANYTGCQDIQVGHIDTPRVWEHSPKLVEAVDFIGLDAYPWDQAAKNNSIQNAYNLFWNDYNKVSAKAKNKPVWITETGWPSGVSTSPTLLALAKSLES